MIAMEDSIPDLLVGRLPDYDLGKSPIVIQTQEETTGAEDDDNPKSSPPLNDHFVPQERPVCCGGNQSASALAIPPAVQNIKTKRSSSASNDSIHERDRFRARFDSFNTQNSSWAILEQDGPDCEVCGSILAKTTKLSVPETPIALSSSQGLTESVTELLFRYSISESIPPLDAKSRFYQNHLHPVVHESGPEQLFDLRSISPLQLSSVFNWYFNRPLPPTNQMFPWLHGLHQDNFTQRSFFMAQKLLQNQSECGKSAMDLTVDVSKPRDARLIMCVNKSTGTPYPKKVLRNSVDAHEILRPIEYLRHEVILQVESLVLKAFPQIEGNDSAVAALTNLISNDCFNTSHIPEFLNLDPSRGVSLRNFHIQVAKLAHCADFVVYCFCDTHLHECKCKSMARLLRIAQLCDEYKGRQAYNVFLLTSTTSPETDIYTSNEDASAPVVSDSTKRTQLLMGTVRDIGTEIFSSWDSGLQIKEKIETTKMSAATKLNMNVWLGNVWDYQIMMHHWKLLEGDTENDYETFISPPEGSKHLYYQPDNSCLGTDYTQDVELISVLLMPRAQWKLFVHCHNDASFPSPNVLAELLFKYTITSHKADDVSEYHHLDFPSAGSIGIGDCKQESLMSIVNTCKLLYLYSSSTGPDSLASLIYCSDGYTELSFLSLCYVIYSKNVTLEDAMLLLHQDYQRPYYLFASDVVVLRKLETLLRKFSPLTVEDMQWATYETITSKEINGILLGKPANTPKHIPKNLRLGYIANSDSDSSSDDSDDDDDMCETSSYLNRSWVEEVEGSLPSRILPHIYLGSLRHANSLSLLTKLGIKKVISVGEDLDWLNGYKFQHNNEIVVDEIDDGNIEIFNISPKSTSHNRHGTSLSVEGVVKVNNLQDDGIDELTRSLPNILSQIDQEYKRTNGQTKILVHCRVGVSRSATVVIAEVMRRLGFNLPQAYLYVRVRRLNIVIQPNLRFMYELFKWEEQERGRHKYDRKGSALREIDWFVMCREIKRLNSPFMQN